MSAFLVNEYFLKQKTPKLIAIPKREVEHSANVGLRISSSKPVLVLIGWALTLLAQGFLRKIYFGARQALYAFRPYSVIAYNSIQIVTELIAGNAHHMLIL